MSGCALRCHATIAWQGALLAAWLAKSQGDGTAAKGSEETQDMKVVGCPSCGLPAPRVESKYCDGCGSRLSETGVGSDQEDELEIMGFTIGSSVLHTSDPEWSVVRELIHSRHAAAVKSEIVTVDTQDVFFTQATCSPTF